MMKKVFIVLFCFSIFFGASNAVARLGDFNQIFETGIVSSVWNGSDWADLQQHLRNAELTIHCQEEGSIYLETNQFKFKISEERGRITRSVQHRNGGRYRDIAYQGYHDFIFDELEHHRSRCARNRYKKHDELTREIREAQEPFRGLPGGVRSLFDVFRGNN